MSAPSATRLDVTLQRTRPVLPTYGGIGTGPPARPKRSSRRARPGWSWGRSPPDGSCRARWWVQGPRSESNPRPVVDRSTPECRSSTAEARPVRVVAPPSHAPYRPVSPCLTKSVRCFVRRGSRAGAGVPAPPSTMLAGPSTPTITAIAATATGVTGGEFARRCSRGTAGRRPASRNCCVGDLCQAPERHFGGGLAWRFASESGLVP